MAKSVLELAVGTGQWDAGLKKAKSALDNFTQANGGLQQALSKDSASVQKFVQMMGQMDSTAKTAKGQMNDYKGTIEQLTMQYNRMTDAQKASIGQDYLQAIDQMRQKYQGVADEVEKINQSLRQAPKMDALGEGMKSSAGLFSSDKMSGMLQVFGGNLMTKGFELATSAATNFISTIHQAAAEGIELARQGEGVRNAFERLNDPTLLANLRQATHGTVTNLELMKAAVKFNDFKLPLKELGTMLAFAQQKAKDTGQSVDYMVDSIVTGLGRKSLMILDNLGLSAAEIKEKMAETGDMTSAVGAIIREQMASAGDYVETAADRATAANVEVKNAMEDLGRTLLPLQEQGEGMWNALTIGAIKLLNDGITPLVPGLISLKENISEIFSVVVNNPVSTGMWDWLVTGADIATQTIPVLNTLRHTIENLKKEAGMDLGASAKVGGMAGVVNKNKKGGTDGKTEDKNDDNTIASLTKKLHDLQQQRIKAIKEGDNDLSKKLKTQISQLKADIKELGGTVPGTATTRTQTPAQRANDAFAKAEQNYKQALEQAAMELKAGTINTAQAKQKEMQAAEARWKAIGDARNIADNPKLQQAQAEAAANYQQLAAEVKTATERQKAIDKATRDLENANQKLTDARREMAQAEQTGDRKAYYAAEKKVATAQQEVTRLETVKVNVEQGRVDLPAIPDSKTIKVNIEATTSNLDAEIQHMKDEMSQLSVGSEAFNIGQAKMVDFTTLRSLINEQIKNGLSIDPEASANLMNQIINGDNISDDTWQGIIDKINEKLAELKIDPIKIDLKTGDVAKEGKETEKSWKNAASAVASVGSAMQSLEDPGAKIAGTIGQAIASIALGFAQATAASSGGGIFAWIAAITGGLATMISTISAIHSTTGYANGGIVGRAGGGFVPGNQMSGDNVLGMVDGVTPVGLNSGELILNKAQQNNLASQMRDGGLQNLHLEATVHAEQIRLALNNNGKRTGRGELVTWKP